MLTCHLLFCKNYILYSSEIIHVLEQEKKQQMILIYLYFLNEHILDKVYNLVWLFLENLSGEDPMLPFHQYYDQANYNYDSFLQIR